MYIEFKNITKEFGAKKVLQDINLAIGKGLFVSLLGPSGSGKTSLMRILAGLSFPNTGTVYIDGQDITNVEAARRDIGLVFQSYALFTHMNVLDNIIFSLKVRHVNKDVIKTELEAICELCEISNELLKQYPNTLSGGQKQRVALARALIFKPKLLLLDEPFSALDAHLRKRTRENILNLHNKLGMTTIMVSHDVREAFDLAQKVAVLNAGRIIQYASPAEIRENDQSGYAEFYI